MFGLIQSAIRHPWLVLTLTAFLSGFGIWAFEQQKIDAYPDISSQMVQIITNFPGRATEEVERQVTIPIEIAMRNVPKVQVIRSRTIFGLSVVQMIFEEGTEGYWARQRVQENLAEVNLPNGASPSIGPLATAYGEIYRYELISEHSHDLTDLRTVNGWVVIPKLLRAAGVADVTNFGGHVKQFAVTLQPAQLLRYGLALTDVAEAIKSNNASAGGSVMVRGSMSFVIRGKGALQSIPELGAIFIKSIGGTPVLLRDIATIGLDYKPPSGIYSKDRSDESVEGIVLMRRGENPSIVLNNIKNVVMELNASALPEGIRIVPYYDRTHLVDSTLYTVRHSVLLGISLVVLILLAFLGRPSLAALVALTIPFSLLFALVLMYLTDIPIGLLSIGAIDFGIIVDGAVIMADSIAHRLGTAHARGTRPNVNRSVLAAAQEVYRSVFFSILMIIAAYLPLLTLTSIEGLLFRPMALTVIYALLGALLFSLFTVPVLATRLFREGYREWENPFLRWSRPRYAKLLHKLLQGPRLVAGGVMLLLLAVSMFIVPRLGFEFLPYMDEGVVWVRANFPEGTALQQTAQFGSRIRELVLEFPDVQFISVQSGRSDSGTDPFPPSRMEIMIGPKAHDEWQQFDTKQALVAAIGERLRNEFPTVRFNFTQPIIDSVTEDTNGTSANLAVEFTGADPDVLLDLARRTVTLIRGIKGAVDTNIEQEGPQPQLIIQPDRALCARYNVRIENVTGMINTALGGEPVGTLYEGERAFDIVVKFDAKHLTSPQEIGRLPVYTPDGVPIPLAQVAKIQVIDGQTIVAREEGHRRLTVRTDIIGRDQGGFVAEAQQLFAREIQVPDDYRVRWLGMFENLERAKKHFTAVIPVTIGLIYVLLLMTFASQRASLLLLLSVPFAFIGGTLGLYVRGMNLNVSSGVGFAALFGVSVMNGVLMVRSINTFRQQGETIDTAIVSGALSCLRPILMASLVAILGLLPASLATGLGSDVQRPLATVIVWGLFSSMILTLFIIPVGYRIFRPGVEAAQAAGAGPSAEFTEPLPAASAEDIVSLLEYLERQGGEEEIFRLADETSSAFDHTLSIVKAAEMLGFIDTPKHMVVLTAKGKQLLSASAEERKPLWRDQLLTLRLFREISEQLQQQADHSINRDFVLEMIVSRMPNENYTRIFNIFINWGRYGDLFSYAEEHQKIIAL